MKYALLLLLVFMTACKNKPKKTTNGKSHPQTNIPVENTTYYFIRHAEKDQKDPTDIDPHLTKAGLERAAFWADFFSDKSLDMIYSTNYTRTIQTVIPLLDQTKLELQLYEPHKLYSKDFLAKTKGKTVLIVGHQINLPDLMNKITGEKDHQKIPADTYGNFYTIILNEDGSTTSFVEKPAK